LRRRLPVLLLVVIAGVQIVLAVHRDLNPWKGGGFGMFSTVDSPAGRHLEVFASGPGFETRVDLSSVSLAARHRAAFYPSRRHLEDVARRVRADWPAETREVRVVVWSLEGDPHLPSLRRALRGEEIFQVGPRPRDGGAP
jgi:hypothetical protein